jgi:hypothetical protein
MVSTIKFVIASLLLCASVPAQEQPRQLKGGGHLLGETAEQFYSEGYIGDLLRACQAKDWKTVSHMSQNADHSSKNNAKDICTIATLSKEQAMSGARKEYKGSGDKETRRADTFTFDRGHLVKIDMVYSATSAEFEGYHPKTFGELLAGLQEAYGAPTNSYTEPVQNAYGVKYDAHRAVWMRKDDVIMLIEQPGANGSNEIVAETLAEYDRAAQAPKTANPLQ